MAIRYFFIALLYHDKIKLGVLGALLCGFSYCLHAAEIQESNKNMAKLKCISFYLNDENLKKTPIKNYKHFYGIDLKKIDDERGIGARAFKKLFRKKKLSQAQFIHLKYSDVLGFINHKRKPALISKNLVDRINKSRNLRSLRLQLTKSIDRNRIKNLFKTSNLFINLQFLDLKGNQLLGGKGATFLSKYTDKINFLRVDLSYCEIDDKGVESLSKNARWHNLASLNLSGNLITQRGAEALANNSTWLELRFFKLEYNKLNAEGAKALASNSTWTKLEGLSLWSTNLGDAGVEALSKNSTWVGLRLLNLACNEISPNGAEALANNSTWLELQRLYLAFNKLSDKGAENLSKNSTWINLNILYLRENQINNKGIEVLSKNPKWNNLQIDLHSHPVTDF